MKARLKDILQDKRAQKIALIIFALLLIQWGGSLLANNEKSRELYKTGHNFQTEENYKSAYRTYEKIPSNYPAYDIVLYQEANCAAKAEDEKTAIKKLRELLGTFPHSKLAPKASYNLAQAYVRIKNYNKAEKQFLKTIKKYSDTDYAIGSYYYLGNIYERKDKLKAADYRRLYLQKAPDGKFAIECLLSLEKAGIVLSYNDNAYAGKALALANQYTKAIKYLENSDVSTIWYYLAKSYEKTGQRQKALDLYKKGLAFYKENEENIHNSMDSYAQLSSRPKMDAWAEIASFAKAEGDYALYNISLIAPGETINRIILEKFPKGTFASEALWQLFWTEYSHQNYDYALELGERHLQYYYNKRASAKILFWIGKIYEKEHNKSKARHYYKKILSLYPDSYYAFRANQRINAISGGKDLGWNEKIYKEIPDIQPEKVYNYNEIKDKYSANVAEMVEAQDYETALSLVENDKFLESWIKYKEGLVSKASSLARDAMWDIMPKPDVKDSRWKLIYPIHYSDNINEFAQKYSVNPIILLSLIKEESHFNPLAVSTSNARGLMQMLPETSKDVARWQNLPEINELMLFQPSTNIKYGAAYYKYLKSNLNDDNLLAVASYNAGPGAVLRWYNHKESSDMDEFIENIPYEQTQTYVKKVFAAYWNYKRIYLD